MSAASPVSLIPVGSSIKDTILNRFFTDVEQLKYLLMHWDYIMLDIYLPTYISIFSFKDHELLKC